MFHVGRCLRFGSSLYVLIAASQLITTLTFLWPSPNELPFELMLCFHQFNAVIRLKFKGVVFLFLCLNFFAVSKVSFVLIF